MENVFLQILNMSITASWLILAVILLRVLLKKAPKFIRCILWGLVGIRLILPFSFESILSLIPSANTIPREILNTDEPAINSGFSAVDNAVNPVISNGLETEIVSGTNVIEIITYIASVVWIIGIVGMLIYSVISYARLHRRVSASINIRDNVYYCDDISTPFILGIIKPRIYLPSGITENQAEYVIAHENAHIKRRDHWWKPFGFILLSVYWFNPLIWIAYVLLCRDIEMACDEKVIKNMDKEYKAEYSETLVKCSTQQRRMIMACPLSFGEVGVKDRIKSVLSYKKPTLWIIFVAIIACIGVTVAFMSNPKREEKNIGIENGYCSIYDVDIEANIIDINFNNNHPTLTVKWENNENPDKAILITSAPNNFTKKIMNGYNWAEPMQVEANGTQIKHSDYLIDEVTNTSVISITNLDITKSGQYEFELSFKLVDKAKLSEICNIEDNIIMSQTDDEYINFISKFETQTAHFMFEYEEIKASDYYTYKYNEITQIHHSVIKDKNGKVLFSESARKDIKDPGYWCETYNNTTLRLSNEDSARYYDVINSKISPYYNCVLGEYENKVIYVNEENDSDIYIVIRDIFDENIFYKKVYLGESRILNPISNVKIYNNGTMALEFDRYKNKRNFYVDRVIIDLTDENTKHTQVTVHNWDNDRNTDSWSVHTTTDLFKYDKDVFNDVAKAVNKIPVNTSFHKFNIVNDILRAYDKNGEIIQLSELSLNNNDLNNIMRCLFITDYYINQTMELNFDYYEYTVNISKEKYSSANEVCFNINILDDINYSLINSKENIDGRKLEDNWYLIY